MLQPGLPADGRIRDSMAPASEWSYAGRTSDWLVSGLGNPNEERIMANALHQHDSLAFGLGQHGSRSPLVRRLLAACAVAALCHAGTALCATFPLGTVNSPTTFAIGNEGLLGEFSDRYTFEVGAAGPFQFESFASTGFSNRFGIPDLQAALYSNGQLVQAGFAETLSTPEGFPSRNVSFSPLVLAAGDYELLFSGTAISFDPGLSLTSSYSGTMSLAPVAAVPEPSTFALATAGVVMLIALRRRRA
jgi:hypothetical protein